MLVVGLLSVVGCEPPAEPSSCDPPRGPSVSWFVPSANGLDFSYEASEDEFKGAGLAVADLTGDGLADVVAGRRGGGLALFENLGGLRFQEVTVAAGLDPTASAFALAVADLDGDGDREIVVAADEVTRIFDNVGNGRFVEAKALSTPGSTEHVLPVDLDGDGLLDLYLSNYDIYVEARSENQLYRNRGGLVFDAPVAAGAGASWAASALDVDGDGDLDLYVANDTLLADLGGEPPSSSRLPADLLLRNDGIDETGALRLTDIATEMGLATPRSSMGGLVADFDRDGVLDLYVSDFGPNKLFLGSIGQRFVEAAVPAGIAAGRRFHADCTTNVRGCLLLSWSATKADFDLDGRDELLITTGEARQGDTPPVLLFSQTDDGGWLERDPGIPCINARAGVASDLDDDGDLDLVLAPKDGPLALYENRAARQGGWLRVALSGTAGRDGIGARVIARFADGHSVVRAVGAGGVVHASTPTDVHFGLGTVALEAIEVEWPSGRRSIVPDPPVGTILRVNEP